MDTAWHPGRLDALSEEDVIALLLRTEQLREDALAQARELASKQAASLLITLNRMGSVQDATLANALREVTGLVRFSAGGANGLAAHDEELNPDFLRSAMCLATRNPGEVLAVNPLDARMRRALTYAFGTTPTFRILEAGDWRGLFARLYDGSVDLSGIGREDAALEASDLAGQDRDAPIVRLVAGWLSEAADLGASDIHVDTRRNALEVRYRVHGALRLITSESKAIATSVVARIKVLAGLDLGERNTSQDGRATIVVRGRRLDIRVSIIATIDGESAVIRLLDRPSDLLSLERLGFDEQVRTRLDALTQKRHGLFVVAGPTGSGKTTTLYAVLEQFRGKGLKILSVEDPVEYHFDHVDQVQVSEKAGRTFAGALRSFLRHDPDIIFVGEIRDGETARIAVQAALTGHLVLATVHAIDTARIRERLMDLGVEAFQLDACLIGSMAQRLVRTLCPQCKSAHPMTSEARERFHELGLIPPTELFEPVGCSECGGDGYAGRTAIAEITSREGGGDALGLSALYLVARGDTSLAEALGSGGS